MLNPSLRQQPREQRAAVIPSKHESSLLDWLQSNGRLIARDNQDPAEFLLEEADQEISGLMDVEDVTYDIDDEDDVIDLDE
jgi:hypothetical protein